MRSASRCRRLMIAGIVSGVLAISGTGLAQTGQPTYPMLEHLNRVLQDAGAPALTADQESSIITLIENFRSAHRPPADRTVIESARRAYENAILNGDSGAAAAQAAIIAKAEAAHMEQMQTDVAAFAIQVIGTLKSGGQLDAVIAQIGRSGLVRLAVGLAAGPGGPRVARGPEFNPANGGPIGNRPRE